MANEYYREPHSTHDLLDRIELLEDSGHITSGLASALTIAIYQQCQIDYDTMQEVYNNSSPEVKKILEDTGVIILLTEEQTKVVKYGV